jgi:hypothetical protein
MKSHRKITSIIALAVTLSVFAPASAPASSLLSGYGGPGQGAQAILGSALLNGPSGRGGGGSGGGGGSAVVSPTPTAPLGAVSTGGQTTGSGPGGHRHANARNGNQTATSGTVAGAYGSHPRVGASQAAAGGNGPLGLSDSAFLFALLALTALLFTGLLTRGLTKASGTRGHAGN